MKLKLGNIVVHEHEFNMVVNKFATEENAVGKILADYALGAEDVELIEFQYIKERVKDVRAGKKLRTVVFD